MDEKYHDHGLVGNFVGFRECHIKPDWLLLYIIVHSQVVAEMVPKGFHKGLGITKTCQLLGIDVKDSYAFGDSANDLEMIECRMALALRPACWRRQQFP